MKKWILLLFTAPTLWAQVTIVSDGKPVASIELPGKVEYTRGRLYPLDRNEIAGLLADYIKKSTGAMLPVGNSDGKSTGNRIVLEVESGKMDIEGFRIEFPDAKTIVITGGSMRGLEYGIYDFLERYLGVRWLFPGELGVHIPKLENIIVPRQNIKQEPAFLQRFLAAGSHLTPEANTYYRWAVFNRANFHSRLIGSHNMWNLVPVAEYGKTRPDFFPILNGERFIPEPGNDIWWQPCYTAPGLAEVVAGKIGSSKFASLGANDGGRHCECERCLKIDGNRKNSLGLPDRSRSYLEFCNKVAKMCPDCTFSVSAYAEIQEPPANLKLASNIVLTITYDSHQWLDSARRESSQALFKSWSNIVTGKMGWYDYVYGHGYNPPRIYTRLLAKNIKWLYENNTRYMYGESFPDGDWQDSIKTYVMYKLLWSPQADVEMLIDDWCCAAVGPQAAPYLKAYFDLLENFWTSAELKKTHWFHENRTYLIWTDPTYLDAYPVEYLSKSETLLHKIVELATNKPRAEYFLKMFLEGKTKILAYKKNQTIREKLTTYNFDQITMQQDFNTSPYSWATWKEDSAHGKFMRDEEGGRNGSAAIMIDANGANNLSMSYLGSVKVVPDKAYRVTVWNRSDKVALDAKISFSVNWQRNGTWMSNSYNVSALNFTVVEGVGEWHKRVIYVVSPNESDAEMIVLLSVNNTNTGKVWFDDITVEMASSSPEEFIAWQKITFTKTVFFEDFNRPDIVWQRESNTTDKFVRDETGGYKNTPALRIDGAAGSWINFIKIQPDKKYKISGRYRGGPINGAVRWQNVKPAWLSEDYTASSTFNATTNWTEFVLYANAPKEAATIVLMFSMLKPEGKAWFDDIKIQTTE